MTKNTATYVVNFGLPNTVLIGGLRVSELTGPHDFDVIVGMDVINFGDFAITNLGGKTCVSFRVPPGPRIDFVEHHEKLRYRAVGKRKKCSCGSGKPYKRCHGK